MKELTIILIVLIFSITSANAGCWYSGKEYPEGSVVNGYTCKADGTWG